MIGRIKHRIKEIVKGNASKSKLYIARKIFDAGIRMILSKIYLRNCNKVGQLVSIKKKPMINNLGKIYIGDEVRIWSNIIQAKLLTGHNGTLTIGKNSRINGVHIDAQKQITIGENCRLAPYTIIFDSDFHSLTNHFSDVEGIPVTIEDDVWIATRVMILKGVTIGKGAVVASGAVVTSDVPPYTLYGGVPAKFIKNIDPPEEQEVIITQRNRDTSCAD